MVVSDEVTKAVGNQSVVALAMKISRELADLLIGTHTRSGMSIGADAKNVRDKSLEDVKKHGGSFLFSAPAKFQGGNRYSVTVECIYLPVEQW